MSDTFDASIATPGLRRVRLLPISVTMLPLLFRSGSSWRLVENPLPADAKFIRWTLDDPHQVLMIEVESLLYSPVEDGARIPEVAPILFHNDDGPGIA